MKETPILFGPEGSPLLGVVTSPDSERQLPVACLMFNMGATSRVGPRRINVKLARELAAQGISSIRFDLAGLGDSAAPAGSARYLEQAVLDLQAAMNLVETMLGIRRFIVIGLCSGGVHGLSLAEADPRVIGLLMFDGYAFPGRRARLERNLRRLLALPGNASIAGKTARWLRRRFSPPAPQLFEPEPIEATMALFRRAMTAITERGAAVFLLYSGTLHVRDAGRDQLGPFAGEPFARRLEYRFIGEIDHTVTSLAAQRIFLDVAGEWALRVAAPGAAPATAAARAAAADTPVLPLALHQRPSDALS